MTTPKLPARAPLRALLLAVFFFFAARVPLRSEGAPPREPGLPLRGEYLTLKIVVLGPGDDLYLWWGHIGLVIEDALRGENRFYDWGVFSFENENFFLNFAFGRLLYSCMVSRAEDNVARSIAANRGVTAYTLDLPPEKKLELFRFAENNVLPENRDYWYHHFKDNCATRVRDIVDKATDGAFKARYGDSPGRFTLRGHVRRHTWFSPFWDWMLNFLMGEDIDTPITEWEEMFLPSEIGMRIAGFSRVDASGAEKPLVSSVEVINVAVGRPGVLDVPPRSLSGELALGAVLAAAALFLAVRGAAPNGKTRAPFRALFGCLQASFGLFFGGSGVLLYFMALFTNHDYTYHNVNMIFVHPLLLAAVPAALVYAFTKHEKKRRRAALVLKWLWIVVFLGGLLCMALNVTPFFHQQNQPTLALVLPFAFAAGLAPEWIARFTKPGGMKKSERP